MSNGTQIDQPYSFKYNGTEHTREFALEISDEEANRQMAEDLEYFFKEKGLSGDELDNAVETAFETVTF